MPSASIGRRGILTRCLTEAQPAFKRARGSRVVPRAASELVDPIGNCLGGHCYNTWLASLPPQQSLKFFVCRNIHAVCVPSTRNGRSMAYASASGAIKKIDVYILYAINMSWGSHSTHSLCNTFCSLYYMYKIAYI